MNGERARRRPSSLKMAMTGANALLSLIPAAAYIWEIEDLYSAHQQE